ncbi:PcfB family protein [Paenibacillus polymyxa]|uniref:PcfB family protein n=1 Tax=Paenibacillus polymyxa TaxID=1406 RepID=UPI0008FCDFD7|nr:PcfB family protein [Paenibacillus polymyxa]APB72521.1 PcfB family protein [Paenibacillus polymyxa]
MSTEAEAANQVVNMSLRSIEVMAKISGEGAKHLAVYLFAALQGQKRTKGSIRLESLLRSGKELKVFAVRNADLETFCTEAKRYGVLYCALRDKKNVDGLCDIMVRAEDASKINRIVERFKLATVDTASIKSEIEKSRETASPQQEQEPRAEEHTHTQEAEVTAASDELEKANTEDFLDELMGKPQAPEESPIQEEQPVRKEPSMEERTLGEKPSHLLEPISEPSEATVKDTPDAQPAKEPERISIRQLLREIREENRKANKEKQTLVHEDPLPSRKNRQPAGKAKSTKGMGDGGRKRGKTK